MTLRLALTGPAEARPAIQSLAAALPPEWVVLQDLDADATLEQAAAGGLDAVFAVAGRDGGDGATALLQRVQAAHPEALRVLALPSGTDAAHRERLASHVAVQQALVEPFGASEVRAAMRRVLTVRSLLRDPALRAALGDVQRLPASPSAYLSLRMLIADDSAGLDDAVQVLRRDPVLAARVLRTANSALYARGRPIHDLAAAVHRLGLQTIAQLVLASEVFSRLSGADADAEARGLCASALAMRIAGTPRDAAMAGSAALLADLGALLPGSVLNAPPLPGELGRTAPRAALLGAALMALWGLPMEMVEAVAFHHRPSMLRGRGLDAVGAVHLSRALVGAVVLDEAYVAEAGLADRLEGWKRWAAAQADA